MHDIRSVHMRVTQIAIRFSHSGRKRDNSPFLAKELTKLGSCGAASRHAIAKGSDSRSLTVGNSSNANESPNFEHSSITAHSVSEQSRLFWIEVREIGNGDSTSNLTGFDQW
jgi:hypothetical protein